VLASFATVEFSRIDNFYKCFKNDANVAQKNNLESITNNLVDSISYHQTNNEN
jgi:hypothetical protein